jgi:hypothetical protein
MQSRRGLERHARRAAGADEVRHAFHRRERLRGDSAGADLRAQAVARQIFKQRQVGDLDVDRRARGVRGDAVDVS